MDFILGHIVCDQSAGMKKAQAYMLMAIWFERVSSECIWHIMCSIFSDLLSSQQYY